MENSVLWENKSPHESRRIRPLRAALAAIVASAFVLGSVGVPTAEAKAAKKTLTAAQKAELRKKGREWCAKNHIRGGAFIVRVEVSNSGKVTCYLKQ